jgi:NADH:ubiquinone oxidoreductase subunit 4 (subunit M)
MFPTGTLFFIPLIYFLAIISVVYASLVALRQTDLKKIIAYSSIAHMNIIVLGIFSLNINGILGSIYLMIGHGFVSSALFFLVGSLYRRFNSRLMNDFGGLVQFMPLYVFMFFFFTLCNTSVPGTFNFIGEFLILLGLFQGNIIVTIFTGLSIFLGAAYSF